MDVPLGVMVVTGPVVKAEDRPPEEVAETVLTPVRELELAPPFLMMFRMSGLEKSFLY